MSSGSSNDELVSQFMAFTGSADTQRAAMYLEMSGGHLETAVGLFLEHGSALAGASPASGGGSGNRNRNRNRNSNFRHSANNNDEVRAPDATQTMRLMDGLVYPAGMIHPAMPMGMGTGHPYLAMGANANANANPLASSAFARDVVNAAAGNGDADEFMIEDDDSDDSDFREDDENEDQKSSDATDGSSRRRQRRSASGRNGSAKNKGAGTGLADMFAPPVHLICNAGGFEGARARAKDSKRWLLVNLQRDSEFSCHALNRDVWRDELVENLIGEGFVFWQEMDTTREGSQYADRYKVYDYPHVGIIDPRTRRLMWKKEGWSQQNPLTAEQFAEFAMDFCSRHSFDKPPQAPRPPGAAAKASSRPAKRPMHEMSEEEQLQAAMRASLQEIAGAASGTSGANGAGGNGNGNGNGNDSDNESDYEYEMEEDNDDADNDDDDDDDVVAVWEETADADSKPKAVETKTAAPAAAAAPTPPTPPPPPPPPTQAPASVLDGLVSFDLGAEPEKGARIQFRMPDGKRKIRKFDPSQSVRHVYAFVAQSNPECNDGKEFTLQAGFPPKDLIGDIDNSIQACSLSGEAITVRWK
eukprot:jgi/Psemu1/251809/estExt_Genewise1Plus.C_340164